jgi:16S rRNA processing protein RimM
MGRVLGAYGLKGWLKAKPYTALPDTLLDFDRWWLAGRNGSEAWKEFSVLSARVHADHVVVELDGLADRESSALWRGALVGVPRKKLPRLRKGEIYWADLNGFVVVNRTEQMLGHVSGMMDTGAHAVLRVMAEDGRERLIPMVPVYLDAIDAEERRVRVDWQLDF